MLSLHTIITYGIASVWFINGFFCKVLNLVPRHQQIVARILGDDLAPYATPAIGVLEILMAVWVLSQWKSRWCAVLQIVTVAVMNVMEFVWVPELLLWGRFNALFAALFLLIVFVHTFILPHRKTVLKHGD